MRVMLVVQLVILPMIFYGVLVSRQGKQSWRATLLFILRAQILLTMAGSIEIRIEQLCLVFATWILIKRFVNDLGESVVYVSIVTHNSFFAHVSVEKFYLHVLPFRKGSSGGECTESFFAFLGPRRVFLLAFWQAACSA